MCTRFAQCSPDINDSLKKGYNLEITHWLDKDKYESKWNVDYETSIPVIVQGLPGSRTSANEWVLCPMKWGMRRRKIGGDRGEYINFFTSKAETATDPSKIWQDVRQVRRCVVPCDGYYVIPTAKKRLPSYIRRQDGRLLLLAGFYEPLPDEGMGEGFGFTIVTTNTEPPFPNLHVDRPSFLSTDEDVNTWLDISSKTWSEALDTIAENRFHDDGFKILFIHDVSHDIRKRKAAQSAHLIKPYNPRELSPTPKLAPKANANSKSKASGISKNLFDHGFTSTISTQATASQAGPSALADSQTQRSSQQGLSTGAPSGSRKRQWSAVDGTPSPPAKRNVRGNGKEREIIQPVQDKEIIYISSDED